MIVKKSSENNFELLKISWLLVDRKMNKWMKLISNVVVTFHQNNKQNNKKRRNWNWIDIKKKLIMRGISSSHYFISISLKFARLGLTLVAHINSTRLLCKVIPLWFIVGNWQHREEMECSWIEYSKVQCPLISLFRSPFSFQPRFSRYHCTTFFFSFQFSPRALDRLVICSVVGYLLIRWQIETNH